MSNDKKKATEKWKPVLDSLGITDKERLDWMSEYAKFHENSTIPPLPVDTTSTCTPSLFPVMMKYSAKLVSADLVAVQPMSMPSMDLHYMDYRYDDARRKARIRRRKMDKLLGLKKKRWVRNRHR